ncbi:MAG: hypothetical protein GY796_05115 [Chloroflexi bacterium]|nr:hypothetical protein [Chloroflexota bacterium]
MNNPTLQTMIQEAPQMLDLTERAHLDQVRADADILCREYADLEALDKLEGELTADKKNISLSVHLAVKLARSKQMAAAISDEIHVSIVFAVYKEHERIHRRDAAHPHGENFLLRKIEQLQWLFDAYPNFSWDMIIVDDGCPDGSGRIAQKILTEHYQGDNVQVLFLAEAITQGLLVTKPMTSTNDSRKGGSIAYGMWTAAQQKRPNHIILFTDADLSTHLGQTGLLVDGIVNSGKLSAIGSRREPASIVVKKGSRNLRGKLFIYLWKRIVYNIEYIIDTQCGFKAFTAPTVRTIVGDLIEKGFAFDIELLLKTELLQTQAIQNTAIGWIDSEALSTTTDIQPYLSMLKGMVAMYQKYLPPHPESDEFAAFIESLDEPTWQRLVDNIPAGIASREPAEFSQYHGVSVADMQATLSQ